MTERQGREQEQTVYNTAGRKKHQQASFSLFIPFRLQAYWLMSFAPRVGILSSVNPFTHTQNCANLISGLIQYHISMIRNFQKLHLGVHEALGDVLDTNHNTVSQLTFKNISGKYSKVMVYSTVNV